MKYNIGGSRSQDEASPDTAWIGLPVPQRSQGWGDSGPPIRPKKDYWAYESPLFLLICVLIWCLSNDDGVRNREAEVVCKASWRCAAEKQDGTARLSIAIP